MASGRELVENKKAKASVWGHFKLIKEGEIIKENAALCNICSQEVKYAGGTSNLSAHVRRHHPDIDKESRKPDSEKAPVELVFKSKTPINPPTISSYISGQTKYPSKSARAVSITNQIGRFLVKDLTPYSLVENEDFRKLICLLDPRYTVPGRQQFSETVIPKMYEQEVLKLKAMLSTAVKIYYLYFTGENISNVLREAVAEWNLSSDPYPPIVTDNASNMDKAGEIFGNEIHVKCYAHTLNLAVQKALKVQRVSHILSRIRRIVSFFHRSSVAAASLKTQSESLSIPYHKLIIDVPTRWNSAFDMLERFLEMQFAVTAVLKSKSVSKIKEKDISSFTDDDLLFAEDVMNTLKPMKTITTSLCTERIPTLSVIQPLQHSIKMLMSPKDDDKPAIKALKSAILNDLGGRYNQQSNFLSKVSFVDPRFKSLPFLEESCKLEIYSDVMKSKAVPRPFVVKQEEDITPLLVLPNLPSISNSEKSVLDIPDAAVDKNNNSPERKKKTKRCESGLACLFNEVFVTGVDPPSTNEPTLMQLAEADVNKYRAIQPIKYDENPLIWWRDHSESLPLLSFYARTVLCIPATAGDIVSSQRAALKSDHVDKLISLKKNMQ
ncbi:hypothetical protein FSP39_018462 [Pinctada imbricata]|uniref:BED-type domain-containing protein n=1 Tax=Pinctada imbricata TaxID=66713 RepID=A0AA89CA42_PINIB|nr:hypothetical protein FSP39_018462 [Pinctada imbricata]